MIIHTNKRRTRNKSTTKIELCDITQREVADKLGVERSTYAYYEVGKIELTVLALIRLSEIFNVKLIDLLQKLDF